jgi:hypothetical protein
VTLGADVHIDRQQLFAAIRRAFADQQPVSLSDIDGHDVLVKIDQGQVILELPYSARRAQISDFMCLSPHPGERTRTLRQLIDRFGPTAPDFSGLLTKTEEHELSNDEVAQLFAEGTAGVAALQSRAASAIKTNQPTLESLIPNSLVYFERFCGPSIAGADHEEYFRSILPRHRKDLMRRDLARGLDICLQGALRDDLMPGAWTEHVGDDELWEALTACDPSSNPFALLGALDIAIGRQHDERYRTFAEEAVRKLIQAKFPRPDGHDTYELLPLFAELVLNRIHGLEGGALQPPCWKRMCAWMQAGFLVRLTRPIRLERDSFREWVQGHQTLAGLYAKLLDLRHEPMYRAAEMSRVALREEVIGRLMIVRERHSSAGRLVPGSDSISEIVARLTAQGSLGWALPGPLDGHHRPAETGRNRLSEGEREPFVEDLATAPDASILSTLAYLSQRYDLGESLLARLREIIGRSASARDETGLDDLIGQLIGAGLIACAQRDEGLASVVASTVVRIAHRVQSGAETVDVLQALLSASAAFQYEDAWAKWLEGRLAEVASLLPAGEPSKTFLTHLQELKKVLKLNLGVHVRAEALASAAN